MQTKMPEAWAPSTQRKNILTALAELELGEYEVHVDADPIRIDYDDRKHKYRIDSMPVVSVTEVLDKTEPKPALTWWGFRVGLAGIIHAVSENKLTWAQIVGSSWEPIISPDRFRDHPDIEQNPKTGKFRSKLEAAMMPLRHHPNAIKDDKADVGTSIHVAAESLGLTGDIPDIGEFPEANRGYVQALAKYWLAHEPEVVHSEVIVGSRKYGFAGRFDKIVQTDRGLVLRDYKTSGGVYASFDRQLSGYDLGWLEMGGDPLVGHEIVWLRPDGAYEVIPTTISHADFLVSLLALTQFNDQIRRLAELGRKP